MFIKKKTVIKAIGYVKLKKEIVLGRSKNCIKLMEVCISTFEKLSCDLYF